MFEAIVYPFPGALFVALFGAATLALATVVASDHAASQATRRERLIPRLADSRLLNMLRLRKLEPVDYLRATTTPSLALHLSICGECSQKRLCDRALREGTVSEFSFCPNGTMIERLRRDERMA